MPKSLFKICVAVLMLLAFIGQGAAYSAMLCDMNNKAAHQHQMSDESITGLDSHQMHSAHASKEGHVNLSSNMTHDAMMSMSDGDSDCCDFECKCSTNACSGIVFLSYEYKQLPQYSSSHSSINSDYSIDSRYINSLYRPPIFA